MQSDIKSYIDSISEEKWEENNTNEYEKIKLEYQKFVTFFEQGKCHYCSQDLDFFNYNEPCCHWLLCPDGMKLKKFLLKLFITEKYKIVGGFFSIQLYLRL